MALLYQVLPSNQEGRILLAIQVLKLGHIQSIYTTYITYNIPYLILYNRYHRIAS
jgi:hypothetical protein